jgi:tetratricopeptide (TPR) repeat protein
MTTYCFLRRAIAVVASLAATAWAYAADIDAQIVTIVGEGDFRSERSPEWRAAAMNQWLATGDYVRTRDASQMALLLRDQTQLRLNQNSLLQIKALAANGLPTRLALKTGRSWMQLKPRASTRELGGQAALEIETPNAVTAIRGTDWELVVDDDGSSLLTVFSGEAEVYNALGRVSVHADEQARVEPGKAPVKVLLTHSRERIQWVTAYRPQPLRWTRKTDSPAVPGILDALVRADALIAQGDLDTAVIMLESARSLGGDGRVEALLARAHLIAGRPDLADTIVAAARVHYADEIEIWLTSADLARYQGLADDAVAAYRRALAIDENAAQAWLGLGIVAAEREHVRAARGYLSQAISLEPTGAGVLGEAGTLETFANNFSAAGDAFDTALRAQPDDYVALTGRGLLRLKRGDTAAALEDFLKVGVIEPSYARAVIYTGIAYYQQGRRRQADEMFRRAAELDPRDPLPHLLLSIVATDAIEPGAAVRAARAAAARLPYLKSLNQVLNDQKGSANLGTALASFGLEDWAQHYAYRAYNPFWAGSHLFLADRFNGTFNKNSELFQGFLSDPLVFGAANRYNTLIPRPGDYVTLTAGAVRQSVKANRLQAVINGYHDTWLPSAYFMDVTGLTVRPLDGQLDGNAGIATVGLGARPTHDLGVFLFSTYERIDSKLFDAAVGYFGTPQHARSSRSDVGVNIKFAPDSQAWFKIGSGMVERLVAGVAQDLVGAQAFGRLFPATTFGDTGDFTMRTQVPTRDAQWRHTFEAGPRWQLTWGVEAAHRVTPFFIRQDLPTDSGMFYYGTRESTLFDSTDLTLSNHLRLSDALQLQLDLAHQGLHKALQREQFVGVVNFLEVPRLTVDDRKYREVNPRLGLAWTGLAGQTLRVAWQKWRRPAGENTLAPIDTVGIPVEDRLVAIGGSLQRLRGQIEWELDALTFVKAFADRLKIDNSPNPGGNLVGDTSLNSLERLRKLFAAGQGAVDIYEDNPDFAAGRINRAGFAINRVVSDRLAVATAWTGHDSINTGQVAPGNALPLLPKHLLQFGGTWVAAPRLKIGALATWRSQRPIDEANSASLASGWRLGINSSWESADKQLAVSMGIDNLLSRPEAAFERKPRWAVQASWRL